ncbi:MAG TPA: PQQ-binding-like beta-propeller repeat protein [Phycisphaerae bacterium]|nr:PQQ-binding-like beta-propeller repeat protein [Phycisphaerae bacterium]
MKLRRSTGVIWIGVLACAALAHPLFAADFLADKDLKALGVQRYWHCDLPLTRSAALAKIVPVDDAIYALTDDNVVYAVHSATGVIRWSNIVADPGQAVRGPTHNRQFAMFTTPGSVRVMSRQTGEAAGEPRSLRGYIIDVVHDSATISIGEAHGVRPGDVLNVVRLGSGGEPERDAIAKLTITVVDPKQAKGRLTRLTIARQVTLGDVVMADVILPLAQVKLPFAASSAAAADEKWLFLGAANERFYSLDILSGFQNWQLLTPKTVTATPILRGDDLFIAGQDGLVLAITKTERSKIWSFDTEGPIFADLVVDPKHVYVASSDRSLYCLDRKTGHRIWRERFDTPLDESPVVCKGRLYQRVPQQGLFVLDSDTGKRLWRREDDARFLVQFEDDAYLLATAGGTKLLKVEAATGKLKVEGDGQSISLATGNQEEQSILVATKQGELACLRSEKAPRLTPGVLAEALRNEAKIRARAELEAQAKTAKAQPTSGPAEAKRPGLLSEEDWLISRSQTKPVGGHGVIQVGEEKAGKAEKGKQPAAEEEEEKGGKAKAAEEEEESGKAAAEEEDTSGSDESPGKGTDEEEKEEDSE